MTILWYIRKWRNCRIFGKGDEIPTDKIAFLHNHYNDIIEAFQGTEGADNNDTKQMTERLIKWQAPPTDWISLHTNGAAKGNPGVARASGVFREHRGEWLGGYAEGLGICSLVKAELKAVLRGLRIAKDRRIQKLWIRLDSSVVVDILQNSTFPPENYSLVRQCTDLLSSTGWQVRVSHCYREANKVADKLVNIGVRLNSHFMYLDSPPKEVHALLAQDIVGVAWSHFFAN